MKIPTFGQTFITRFMNEMKYISRVTLSKKRIELLVE